MKRGFVLRQVAEREFDESIAWYERERDGLGEEFRGTIEEYFQRIATTTTILPKVATSKSSGTRSWALKAG